MQRGILVVTFVLWMLSPALGQPSTAPSTQPYPKPILDGYTADPHAVVFRDTYYVYPTSDKEQWQTTDFSVWSSKNLIDWKKEGMVLDVAHDLKWAHIRAWAPAAIEHNGKYYLYYAAEQKIGVAVADKPTGPFADPLGAPLIPQDRQRWPGQVIDVFAFIDDDGGRYLYWGQGNLYVRKLNDDMISFADDAPQRLTPPARQGGRFNEGVFVIKRKGVYYFMWSENDARSEDYRVAYGTSRSPLGPIEVAENPVILKKAGPVVGTGHHSVINVPGTDRWYIIYHRHAIPNGNGYTRETCLARMEFDDQGRIKPVDPLAEVFPPGSKGEPIPATP
jgi:beta-xylosidase